MPILRPALLAVALVLSLVAHTAARAQPLAERVPADAIVYVGWQGADTLGEAYDASHLKGLIDSTNLRQLFTETLPQLMREGMEKDLPPEEVEQFQRFSEEFFPAQWGRPWAFYVRMADGDDDVPMERRVRFGFFVSPGDRADAMRRSLIELLAQAPNNPDEPKPELFDAHGLLGVAVGEGEVAHLTALQSTMAGKLALATAAPAVKSPVFVAYADVAASLQLVDEGIESDRFAPPDAMQKWHSARDSLELSKFKSVLLASGFNGKNWSNELHVDTNGTPALLSLFAGAPIADADLAVVPRGATWLSASRFDMAKLLDLVRASTFAAGLPPEKWDQAMAQAEGFLGVNLETRLLRQLGDLWVMYNDPGVAGPMGLGVVAVNNVRDADAVRESLAALEAKANAALAAQESVPFRFKTIQQAGLEIHSLTFPMFAPSWAVANGRLYVALFPQAIMTADLYAKQQGNSIVQNEKFQAVRAKLGDRAGTALSFADLPQTAPVAYQQFLMFSQMAVSFMPDEEAPAMLLPPLASILPHLEPAGSVMWVDDSGLHVRTVSPFPGSSLLNPQGMMTPSVGALGVGIMLPALGAARRTARQMQSNTQARGIHQAAVMYAQGNKSRLPDEIGPLLRGNFFTSEYLISPTTTVAIPPDLATWPAEKQDAWVRQNSSYVLLPGLMETLDTEEVALFLKPSHAGEGTSGVSVAFQDNHVEWLPLDEADALFRAQTGKGLDELTRMSEAGTLVPGSIKNDVQRRGGQAPPAPF